MPTALQAFLGLWRITSIEGWERPEIDLLGPAFVEFAPRKEGGFRFAAVTGEIDYRVSKAGDRPVIEWAWLGDDDGSEASGRGWAIRQDANLVGTIFMFGGDEFHFEASPWKARRTSRGS
jgi:hypothetical protein